jgi:hypothetical protein
MEASEGEVEGQPGYVETFKIRITHIFSLINGETSIVNALTDLLN